MSYPERFRHNFTTRWRWLVGWMVGVSVVSALTGGGLIPYWGDPLWMAINLASWGLCYVVHIALFSLKKA